MLIPQRISDESDMYVANPDITTWLQSQASLSPHVYTLNRMLLKAKQSDLRVPPKVLLEPIRIIFPTIIIFMIDHHCHGRVLEYSIAVLHP